MGRARVDFRSSIHVGKDTLLVTGVRIHEPPHFSQRCRNALSIRVVEGEAHAENDAALEALAGVGSKSVGIVVAAAVEQEGSDRLDVALVEANSGQ